MSIFQNFPMPPDPQKAHASHFAECVKHTVESLLQVCLPLVKLNVKLTSPIDNISIRHNTEKYKTVLRNDSTKKWSIESLVEGNLSLSRIHIMHNYQVYTSLTLNILLSHPLSADVCIFCIMYRANKLRNMHNIIIYCNVLPYSGPSAYFFWVTFSGLKSYFSAGTVASHPGQYFRPDLLQF